MTALLDSPYVETAPLSALTDDELAELYRDASDAQQADIMLVMDARDRAAKRELHNRQRRRNDPVAAEWREMAYQDYLAAESELRGNLVRRGSQVTDGFTLWSGSRAWAESQAAADLIDWWAATDDYGRVLHPRVTLTDYRNQLTRAREAYRNDNEMVADECSDVRPIGAGNSASAGADADGWHGLLADLGCVRDSRPAGPDQRPGPGPRRVLSDVEARAEARADRAGRAAAIRDRIGQRGAESADTRAARAAAARQAVPGTPVTLAAADPAAATTEPRAAGPVGAALAAIGADPVLGPIRDYLAQFATWQDSALGAATLWTRGAAMPIEN